jgi:excisionase family DNA binding protein
MDYDDLLTTKEAGQIKGWSDRYVAMLIREGRLKAKKKGGIWLIRRKDLDNIEPSERPVGRPRKS